MLYDTSVFIGRFQPFHNGHLAVVEEALKISKNLIILVGSSFQPRTTRNPFTYSERYDMIQHSLESLEISNRVRIMPIMDYPYDDSKWIAQVRTAVMSGRKYTTDATTTVLVGHSKDSSSYYLKMFPGWESYEVGNVGNINATDIRKILYSDFKWTKDLLLDLPMPRDASFEIFKSAYQTTLTGNQLAKNWLVDFQEGYAINKKYKDAWKSAPYPPTFVTTDAVVSQSGHILMIRRKSHPGKGLWALPGGFVNQGETLLESCLRELKEETGLKVAEAVLLGSLSKDKPQMTFDDPNRSERGRTITTAFNFELRPELKLPKVKGGDDADKAKWVPFDELDSSCIFEDHYSIIQHFLKI